MKQFTNLNITTNDKNFNYLVEFNNDVEVYYQNKFFFVNKYNENRIIIYDNKENNLNKSTNVWNKIIKVDDTNVNIGNNLYNIFPITHPEKINLAEIKLYFPRYSVETYHKNTDYSLCMKTWINGFEVILGNYLIKRIDSLASEKLVTYNNIEYYEYIVKNIIDPWDLQYSDDWALFREKVCGQHGNMNNTGSNLFIELNPIDYSIQEQYYIKKSPYQGCSNSLLLSNNISNFMSLNITHNFDTNEKELGVRAKIIYNSNYDSDFNGFKQYLSKTYHTIDPTIQYELVVKDDNNIYKYLNITDENTTHLFSISDVNFEDWNDWRDGLNFDVMVTIKDNGEDIIILKSNILPITKELFKFLIKTNNIINNDKKIYNINLNEIKMEVYNLNVVNKIQKNIVQVDRPTDYKSNIIKPIFFKVQDLAELQLHAGMTENICLNLDDYKNKVDVFYLRIDGILFNEQGHTAAGVIFKIVNNKIKNKMGNYYLLDSNLNMITTGKYTTV